MMKKNKLFWMMLVAVGGGIGLSACGTRKLSVVDKIFLNDVAMRFDHSGAEITECTLVSQFERGRSSSAGGGAAG